MLAQRDGGGDEALDRGQRPGVQFLGRQCGGQAAGVGDQAAHETLAEHVIGGGGEEIVMPEPGGDAGADDVGAVGDGVGRRAGDPFRHQRARAQAGGIGAEGAQVAQPGEAVGAGAEARRIRRSGSSRPAAAAAPRRRFPVHP